MADGINAITPVGLNVNPPKGMTLPEMMSLAQGAQAYKQAQQMNPISLSTAQAESERARTEADVASGTAKPRIRSSEATAQTAETGANTAHLENLIKHSTNAIQQAQPLMLNPKLTANDVSEYITKTITNAGGDQDAIKQALNGLNPAASPTEAKSFLAQKLASKLDRQAQAEKLYPTASQVGTGAATAFVVGGNPSLTGMPASTEVSTPIVNKLPPTTQVYNPNTKQMEFISPTQQNTPKNVGAEAPIGVPQLATINASNFGEYQKNLINKVDADNQVVQRTAEMKDLLSEFKPGAGSETRMDIAKKLQAIGAPNTLVDSIARGDLSAGQSFNKFIAQMVSSAAHQAGGTGAGVGEIDNYIKNNPDINTDPRALNRFIGFVEKQSARDRFELNALSEAQKDPNFKPENWINDYSKLAIKAGVMPRPVNPAGTTTQNKNAPNQRTVVRSGTIVQGKKTLRVTEYSDGTQDIKEAK